MSRKIILLVGLLLGLSACGQPGVATGTPATLQPTQAVTPAPTASPSTSSASTAVPPAATNLPPTATSVFTPTLAAGTLVPGVTGPAAVCAVAYTDGNDLFCLGEDGNPRKIATGPAKLNSPAISSDGTMVAYSVTMLDGTTPIWLAMADGSAAHPLVGRDQLPQGDPKVINTPLLYEWQPGRHLLFFNTRYVQLSGQGGPGPRTNSDLWIADADTGKAKQVLARQSVGRFSLSPDGKFVALSLPQAIQLMNADSLSVRPLLDFPVISTHSEYFYLPGASWSPDGSSFSVAIPSAEPLAMAPHATFYRLGVDGITQTLGIVPGNFVFGNQPEISPDGKHAVYSRFQTNSQVTMLHLVSTDGSGDTVLEEKVGLNSLSWSPDSQHYAYSVLPSTGGFIAGLDGHPQPFAPGSEVVDLKWLDASHYVFYAQVNGKWGLYVQQLGEAMKPLVNGLAEGDSFALRP